MSETMNTLDLLDKARAAAVQTAKTNKPLKFKNRKKLPLHRLPFVDTIPDKVGICFWAVPETGGYLGGHDTGAALARIYMKYLKEHGQDAYGGNLQLIVTDMFGLDHLVGRDSAKLGQAAGFFAELGRWLAGAAKHLSGGLDKDNNNDLLKAANEGLNFDTEAYIRSLPDKFDLK